MTLTEQVKILDDKIRANKAQYDLDREAAKISALSSRIFKKQNLNLLQLVHFSINFWNGRK